MKEKIKLITSIFSFILSFIFLAIYIFFLIKPKYNLSELETLVILSLSCIFFYLGNLLFNKYHNINKPLKTTLYYILILYIILLINLTIFDYRRGTINFVFSNKELLNNYLKNSVRLSPFSTIIGYFKALFHSRISINIFIYNIIGNIICLMPFALLLPLLYPKQNKTKIFIFTIILISLGIEISEFLTASGTFDIDDIILNSLGATLAYLFLKLPFLKILINKIFYFKDSNMKIK